MKHYSFLQEIFTTALGAAGLGYGAYSLVRNARQNSFTKRYMSMMYNELILCDANNRQKAIQIVDKYTRMLTQMYSKIDKNTFKKLSNAQAMLNIQFRTPLIQIITNKNDLNWKKNVLTFTKKNISKINTKNVVNTTLGATSIALGGATMSGVGNIGSVATSTLMTGAFSLNVVRSQLRHFNSNRYINKMLKELESVNDNDRQSAINIVNKYCYDISNTIQSIVNKSGKKINFDVQQQMRLQFMNPMINIINNPKNRYWKVSVIDFVKEQKIEQNIQNVCNNITQLLIPKLIKK